jgi:hypothetical protein
MQAVKNMGVMVRGCDGEQGMGRAEVGASGEQRHGRIQEDCVDRSVERGAYFVWNNMVGQGTDWGRADLTGCG